MTYDGRKEEEETSIVALLSVVAPFEVPLTPNGELGSVPGLSFVHCAVHCTELWCTELHYLHWSALLHCTSTSSITKCWICGGREHLCGSIILVQSYEIKSPPWTILWFRILGIFSVENIKRLCLFMFQTWDNSQLLRRVLWISAELTIVSSLKHKNTQPLYIFSRENPKNSEPQNGPRRGLDFIALD